MYICFLEESVVTQNRCCDHSLEPSCLGDSNGGHNICFLAESVVTQNICCDHSLEPSRLDNSYGG